MMPHLWLNRLRVMTAKELLQLGRDLALIGFIAYAFSLDIYLAGAGFSFDLHNVPFVLLDGDRSEASRELAARFQEPIFSRTSQPDDARTAMAFLDQARATAVLDIPPDFESSLRQGKPTEVQMQIDATNNLVCLLTASYAEQIVSGYGLEVGLSQAKLVKPNMATLPVIDDRIRVWFNPNQNDAWFMALVELFTMITVLSFMLPATALVREKERGTIEQLQVSPLSPTLIILPKIISMAIVILVGAALSLFFIIQPVFAMPLRGSLLLFFTVTALYVFATSGIGIAAASFARTQGQVAMLLILVIMPILLLSGTWTPTEAMPPLMRKAVVISPLKHYLDAGLGILFRGAGLREIWPSIAGLLLTGVSAFVFNFWAVRRK